MQTVTIFWFRRDLRLHDNAGLYHALKSHNNVLPIFIFDKNILQHLSADDKRVAFIHKAVTAIHILLEKENASIKVLFASPTEAFKTLLSEFKIEAVYTNHDYEPYAAERDSEMKKLFSENKIEFKSYKDQCIFEKSEVTKDDGKPYTVFTPYANKWKKTLTDFYLKSYPTEKYFKNFLQTKPFSIPTLKEIGFENAKCDVELNPKVDNVLLQNYKQQRDFPAIKGTSRLSVHLRFGTISIRELTRLAQQHSETWLNELIWRDFYMMILFHFPQTVDKAFKPSYDRIPWRNNEAEFEKWCNGETGYPIVDAGIRELNNTGFMHNRVRMIVASFLVKHLLIDWRWGERYFAEKLLDFDLSANVGGWQWAASSGCDAAPYFRVFSPAEQTKKFDAQLLYIKKWVSEFSELHYPQPMVDHKFARDRVLRVYKEALGNRE